MSKKHWWLLLLIFFLGAFLRFYRLGEIPVGLHRDEAFLGYNAWSILQTGKDINGNFLPLHLKSFLYSPAGYAYFSLPFLKIFGLSAFSVRFASAFFGSLTILLVYFLSKEIFSNLRIPSYVSLIASFLLAISPWHLNLSRTATENVIVVFFLTLGAWLWLVWLKKRNLIWLVAGFFSFGLTLTLYQAPRAFLPLFIPILILASFQFFRKDWRWPAAGYFLVIILPLFLILRSSDLSLRWRTVSLWATQETQLTLDQQIREDGTIGLPTAISRFFHNKPLGFLNAFIANYFRHFSFEFLLTEKGLPDRYRVPLSGLIYYFELPLILIGLWSALKLGQAGLILVAWLLLAPVGSALAFDDVPNLQRILIVFPALSIMVALGVSRVIAWLKGKFWGQLVGAVFLGLAFYNISSYFHQYYLHGPLFRPWYRQGGYQKLVASVNELLPKYSKAVITNRESAPTIFFLFFSKYDPALFQKETARILMRDFDRINFSSYEFSEEECPQSVLNEKGVLYVNSANCESIKRARLIEEIRRSDNSAAFRIEEYLR